MTDVTMDVGVVRPGAATWPPGEQRLEGSAVPGLEGLAQGLAATPGPPVGHRSHRSSDAVSLPRMLGRRVRTLSASARRHRPELVIGLACLAVMGPGVVVTSILRTHGLSSTVALLAVLCVAARTFPRLRASADVDVLPVLRSLAVAFAAAAAASVLGPSGRQDLAGSAWVVVTAGMVIVATVLLRRRWDRPARVIVVGDSSAIRRAAVRWSDGSVHVVGGVLAGRQEHGSLSILGVPTVSGIDQVGRWAARRSADLVVALPGAGVTGHTVRHLAWRLERTGIDMAVADLAGDAAPHRVRACRLGTATVVRLAPSRRGPFSRAAKAALDRLLGAILLACASPFLLATAVLIRLDSPGPAFFRQVRVGRDGRLFTMYKLRTMHQDAESQLPALRPSNEGAGPLFKLHDDPRVTRVGRLLRRTSMDELPQLVNVVRGEMSLVGPRPALEAEVAEYDDTERRRLVVKPGMTGLWQVSGRSHLGWDTSIALDLDYVDNWRMVDDLRICLRTVGAVAKADGAF